MAPSSLQTRPSLHAITSATIQPSMACGPPIAAISTGMVMKGPTPIIVDMFRAVAWSRPKRRGSAADALIARSHCLSPRDVLNRVRHIQDFTSTEGHHEVVTPVITARALKLLPQSPTKREPAQKPAIETPFVPNTAFIMMWMDKAHPELEDVSNAVDR